MNYRHIRWGIHNLKRYMNWPESFMQIIWDESKIRCIKSHRNISAHKLCIICYSSHFGHLLFGSMVYFLFLLSILFNATCISLKSPKKTGSIDWNIVEAALLTIFICSMLLRMYFLFTLSIHSLAYYRWVYVKCEIYALTISPSQFPVYLSFYISKQFLAINLIA